MSSPADDAYSYEDGPSFEEIEEFFQAHSEAQYEAWLCSEEPYDFTGTSYLDEFDPPLRPPTPAMAEFDLLVGERRDQLLNDGVVPAVDHEVAAWLADVDDTIHIDGDYFIVEQDPEFLCDDDNLTRLAIGRILAECDPEFWWRLRSAHSETDRDLVVREANAHLHLRGLRPQEGGEGASFEALFHIAAQWTGGDADSIDLIALSAEDLEDFVLACATRQGRQAQAVMDRLAAAVAKVAQKHRYPTYRKLEVASERLPGAQPLPDRLMLTWREAPTPQVIGPRLSLLGRLTVARRRGARQRAPRPASCRGQGSRRVTSRSAGGGSSGDDDGGGGSDPPGSRRVAPALKARVTA